MFWTVFVLGAGVVAVASWLWATAPTRQFRRYAEAVMDEWPTAAGSDADFEAKLEAELERRREELRRFTERSGK